MKGKERKGKGKREREGVELYAVASPALKLHSTLLGKGSIQILANRRRLTTFILFTFVFSHPQSSMITC